MRYLLKLWFCIVVLLVLLAEGNCQADPIKVFLFGGQSNMRGSVGPAPVSLRNQTNVLYSYNTSSVNGNSTFQRSTWGVLDHLPPNGPGQFLGGTYGPELTAAKALAEHFGATTESPIAVIKVSRDASRMRPTLNDSWNVAYRSNLSNSAMLRIFYDQVEAALANVVGGEVPEYEIAGMFWMQGESDSNPAEGHSPANFKAATQAMIADIRTTLGAPQMPFFLGELDDYNSSGDSIPFRAAQLEIATEDPHTHFVSTVGLSRYPDGGSFDVHFDASGIQGLGERFADAYIAAALTIPEPSTCGMLGILGGFLFAVPRPIRR